MQEIYQNVDFKGNEVTNASLEKLASAPLDVYAGRFYYNTTLGKFGYYNGVIWNYLENTSASSFQGNFDASTDLITFPGDSGTLAGDFWVVNVGGTKTGLTPNETLNPGDLLYANVDNPSSVSDYFMVESFTVDASTSVKGVVRLADGTVALTGTDAERAITAATLKIVIDAKGYAVNIGDGISTSFNVDHSLNSKDVFVEIYDNSTFNTVVCGIVKSTLNRVVITATPPPASGQFRVIVKKNKF